MSAIETCRTAALGGHVEACEDCGNWRVAYNSCRNRHCPKCQGAAARTWLAEREADLLPVDYFHVVFTLPAEVADIAWQNKALVYDLLFKAAAQTMLTIAADPRHLGARIGITAVLHTWGTAMSHQALLPVFRIELCQDVAEGCIFHRENVARGHFDHLNRAVGKPCCWHMNACSPW